MSVAGAASVEQENRRIVERFNSAWSAASCDAVLPLLASNCEYMVYEGGPIHVGPKAIEGAVRPFMARFARIEFEILRLNVTGPVVAHERTECYFDADDELDTRFHVVGLLVIKDGKIVIWRDYSMPGAEQRVGPLCTTKN